MEAQRDLQFNAVLPEDPAAPDRADKQRTRLFDLMTLRQTRDWWTLAALSALTHYPVQSVSARLRDFRKEKYGGHTVAKRLLEPGVWQYRLTVKD